MFAPEVLRRTQRCTTGCGVLDALLQGGVAVGHVTELVGESTAGKTLLCLQLLLAAQLPLSAGGLAGRSLLVATEGPAPLARLASLAAASFPSLSNPTHNVLVAQAGGGPDALMAAVGQALAIAGAPPPPGVPPVRLLVFDSIAAPFRDKDVTGGWGGASESAARSAQLYRLAAALKAGARRHGLAVVVTNHVVDAVVEGSGGSCGGGNGGGNGGGKGGGGGVFTALEQACGGRHLLTSGRRVAPSLGLHWAHCVGTRLFLSRAMPATFPLPPGGVVARALRVVFSPHLAAGEVGCVIDGAGMRGTDEARPQESGGDADAAGAAAANGGGGALGLEMRGGYG